MGVLIQIMLATLLSSVLSIILAGLISFKFLDRYMSKMLCISTGLLITVAFTHLLPETFEIHENAVSIGWTLLVSVLFLFGIEYYFNSRHSHTDHEGAVVSEMIENSRKGAKGGNAKEE